MIRYPSKYVSRDVLGQIHKLYVRITWNMVISSTIEMILKCN